MEVSNIAPAQFPTKDQTEARIRKINNETPIFWTTSLIKSPQELTVRTTAKNNIMLENVMQSQAKILEQQDMILKHLGIGQKLNTVA